MSKPKVIKDYDKVDEGIISALKVKHPYGFEKHLITFKNHKGKLLSALPYEMEDRHLMIRMTRVEAQQIQEADRLAKEAKG